LHGSSSEIAALRQDIAQRFHKWALDQCAAEVAADFVHLRTIRGSGVLGHLEFIEEWPPEDLIDVMQANVTSGKPGAAITESQQELLRRLRQGPAIGFGPRYKKMLDRYAAGHYRVERGVIRRALKRDLQPVLGRPDQVRGALWKHRTELDKWTIITDVDSGGSARQFELGHTVRLGDANLVWASPARWWGVGMQTVWDRIDQDDVNDATGAAAALCRYFIEQLPKVLHGL
jgi:hypothetical protein